MAKATALGRLFRTGRRLITPQNVKSARRATAPITRKADDVADAATRFNWFATPTAKRVGAIAATAPVAAGGVWLVGTGAGKGLENLFGGIGGGLGAGLEAAFAGAGEGAGAGIAGILDPLLPGNQSDAVGPAGGEGGGIGPGLLLLGGAAIIGTAVVASKKSGKSGKK